MSRTLPLDVDVRTLRWVADELIAGATTMRRGPSRTWLLEVLVPRLRAYATRIETRQVTVAEASDAE